MFQLANSVKGFVKIKQRDVNITNWVFKLHYRLTCAIILLACCIVGSHDWVGEKILCTHSDSVEASAKKLDHVISQYCFFMSLFTVDRHHNKSTINGEVAHPGVGSWNYDSGEKVTYYKWYQWVPYVLLVQAFSFYIPYYIWKLQEKNAVSKIVIGFDVMTCIGSEGEKIFNDTVRKFNERLNLMKPWCHWMFVCEVLNLLNVILQFFLTDLFLDGKFTSLGVDVIKHRNEPNFNPLDVAFPKVVKCLFKKFGPTGSIQANDVICVLSINIANEKIYLVLWWWYIVLFIISLSMLVHRVVSRLTFTSQLQYNMKVLSNSLPSKPDDNDVAFLVQNLEFCEWVFLSYMLSNMDGLLAKELIHGLAASIASENKNSFNAAVHLTSSKNFDYVAEESPNVRLLNVSSS